MIRANRRVAAPLAAVVVAWAAAACAAPPAGGGAVREAVPAQSTRPSAGIAGGGPAHGDCRRVVVAAGDIVNDTRIADRTGRLAAAQHPGRVLVLGDGQYETGSLADYRARYDRTAWGRLKAITRPVPGNHDYLTPGASGYFAYFGHPPRYYAFDLGCGWRAYALDSEISLPAEVAFLRRDLAAHPGAPVLAYWHRPRWSSGTHHGDDAGMQPFWTALAGRRGLVLNGHEHNYERFGPIGGLREFVVGTGGSSTYPFGPPAAGSQRRVAHTPGVLRLALTSHGYGWAFLDVGGRVLDQGSS